MFGMWDVGRAIFFGMWDVDLQNALSSHITVALTQSTQSDRLKKFYSCFNRIWTFLTNLSNHNMEELL